MDKDVISEVLTTFVQSVSEKLSPSGWYQLNCPMCMSRGEPTPDRKRRGGFKIEPNGALSYWCFRCGYKAHWEPGFFISWNLKNLLIELGMPESDVEQLRLYALKHERAERKSKEFSHDGSTITPKQWKEKQIEGAKYIADLLEEGCDDPRFLFVCRKLVERGDVIAQSYEYMWSPQFPHSLIIPVYYSGRTVGYIRRNFKGTPKYLNDVPKNCLFNIDAIRKKRRFLIVVEGPFDAIAVDGVAVLGSHINENQKRLLEYSGHEIIVVPDRDMAGRKLVKQAVKNDWYVSIPPTSDYSELCENKYYLWDRDIKDCADAVKKYGRVYTLASIIENRTKSRLKIELLSKGLLK